MVHADFPRGAAHTGSAWTHIWAVFSYFQVDFRLLIFGLQLRGNFSCHTEENREVETEKHRENFSPPPSFKLDTWYGRDRPLELSITQILTEWKKLVCFNISLRAGDRAVGPKRTRTASSRIASISGGNKTCTMSPGQTETGLVACWGGGGWHFKACCMETFFIYFWGCWGKYELKAKDCGEKYL